VSENVRDAAGLCGIMAVTLRGNIGYLDNVADTLQHSTMTTVFQVSVNKSFAENGPMAD